MKAMKQVNVVVNGKVVYESVPKEWAEGFCRCWNRIQSRRAEMIAVKRSPSHV